MWAAHGHSTVRPPSKRSSRTPGFGSSLRPARLIGLFTGSRPTKQWPLESRPREDFLLSLLLLLLLSKSLHGPKPNIKITIKKRPRPAGSMAIELPSPDSVQAGRVLPEPDDVRVIGLVHCLNVGMLHRRHRARVAPAMDFRVAVGEREAARLVMIAGGKVGQLGLFGIGVAAHIDYEKAVVDAVGVFVQENPGHRRRRVHDVRHFQVFSKAPVADFV